MSKKQPKSKNHKLPKGYGAGIKRVKNQSVLGEERKVQLNLTLTPTAKEYFKVAAQAQGIAISAMAEQWARTILSQYSVGGGKVNNLKNNHTITAKDQEPDEEKVRMQQEREKLQAQIATLQERNQKLEQQNQQLQNQLNNVVVPPVVDMEAVRDHVLKNWRVVKASETKERIKKALDILIEGIRRQ